MLHKGCCGCASRVWRATPAQLGLPRRQLQLAAVSAAERAMEPLLQSDRESAPQPSFQALLLDAAGTLISPSEPVAQVYLRYGLRHGCNLGEGDILANFRRAFNTPWAKTTSRYVGDGRPFWQFIVREATGCASPDLLEEVYEYYSQARAWHVTPGAVDALQEVRSAGIKLGLVSNFDTRLRPLLSSMGLAHLFDTLIISAEEGFEKPNPTLFELACSRLGVQPGHAVHVGDDRRNDVTGARCAGCTAWLWGSDVRTFKELAARVIRGLDSDTAF